MPSDEMSAEKEERVNRAEGQDLCGECERELLITLK